MYAKLGDKVAVIGHTIEEWATWMSVSIVTVCVAIAELGSWIGMLLRGAGEVWKMAVEQGSTSFMIKLVVEVYESAAIVADKMHE